MGKQKVKRLQTHCICMCMCLLLLYLHYAAVVVVLQGFCPWIIHSFIHLWATEITIKRIKAEFVYFATNNKHHYFNYKQPGPMQSNKGAKWYLQQQQRKKYNENRLPSDLTRLHQHQHQHRHRHNMARLTCITAIWYVHKTHIWYIFFFFAFQYLCCCCCFYSLIKRGRVSVSNIFMSTDG